MGTIYSLTNRGFDVADMNWVTRQIAVGGLVYTDLAMAEVAGHGVTHILNMSESDDKVLAARHGIESFWNYVPDDFQPKPPSFFDRGVAFATRVLADERNKLLVHCAAGIHRAPMMALAIMTSTGWNIWQAQRHMKVCRSCVSFPDVYNESVQRWLLGRNNGNNGHQGA
jgi:protein-tyrosine phosphatase